MTIQRRPMDVDSSPKVREKMMREEEHVTMVKPEEEQRESPMKQNILEEKNRTEGWTLNDIQMEQSIHDTEERTAEVQPEPEPESEPLQGSEQGPVEEPLQKESEESEPVEEPLQESKEQDKDGEDPSEESDADDSAEDNEESEDKDGDKEQTEEQEYNPWETFKDKGPVEQFMQFQAMSLGALNVEGGPGTKLKSVWDTAAYLSQSRQKKDGKQEDGEKKEDGQDGLDGLKEDTDGPPTPIEDAPKEKMSRRERRRMKKNGDKNEDKNGDKKSAQQRRREEMVRLYEEIRNGNISPTSFKGKRIIRQMRRAGYVGLYRLDYITETDRYVIQFDMVKRRDLPQDAHHMTGEPGNYGFDRNGVVFDSARENGFTAISQFNYMHNHKIEDAFNYKWLSKDRGKFNMKWVAIIVVMLVFSQIYVAYTFR